MRILCYLLVSITVLMTGCKETHPQPVETQHENPVDTLTTYLMQFPDITLPLSINGCGYDISELKSVRGAGYAVGKFPIEDGTAVVTLQAADCMLPLLTTYSKKGRKTGSEVLAIGYCDDGPCQECSEYMEITSGLQLYVSDTIRHFNCDEDHNKIDASEIIHVVYKEGRISANGVIEISGEKEKNF